MGRNPKSASLITGNHISETEKQRLTKFEQETVGASDRLEQGLKGLYEDEFNQLNSQDARMNYHILSIESHKSSAIGNIHISTLIDLANEMEYLKRYEKAIQDHGIVMFVGEKPVPNPAVKMRQDSLKSINAIKSFLGLGAVDVITLARQRAEMNETDSLTNLFADDKTEKVWEEDNNEI